MAYGITPNLTNISDKGLQEAWIGGMASAMDADLSFVRFFPYDGMTYSTAGYAPPSPYSANVPEGNDVDTESIAETYTKNITVSQYTLGWGMSLLAKSTLPTDVTVGLYRELGGLAVRFFAGKVADLLNNAAGTTTTADGVALASASHTSDAGNQSNYLNSNLAFTAYESAVRNMWQMKNHKGVHMGARPNMLLTNPALDVTSFQILNATHNADNRSTPNPNSGRGVSVNILPEITATTFWSLLDTAKTTFRAPVVRGPSPWVVEFDEKSGNYYVRDIIAAGFGIVDWRGYVQGDT